MRKIYPRHTINLTGEVFTALYRTLLADAIISGDSVKKFEEKFADYIGVRYAAGVGSARKGLYLILKSLNFNKGDEVIITSYTFHPLPIAVTGCGLNPVFVDVNPDTYNIDPSLIAQKITKKTKAIILTHMFGQPCDMDPIMRVAGRFNLIVIEDCAHACGARYGNRRVGSIGDVAIFSFNKGKNMPCFGGGMITTNDDAVYKNIISCLKGCPYPTKRSLLKNVVETVLFFVSTHRRVFPYSTYPAIRLFSLFGHDLIDSAIEEKINIDEILKSLHSQTKLSNLQAAVGLAQIEKLDMLNQRRKANAEMLIARLKKIKNISVAEVIPNAESTYLYVRIKVPDIKFFRRELLAAGIDTKRDDMSACSHLEIFREDRASCPVAERLPSESIEIPNSPFLDSQDISYIAEQIEAVAQRSAR